MFKVKRLLAIVLSMLMLVQALPMAALADEWSADTSFVLFGAKDTYTIQFVDENDATLLNQNQLIEAGESAVAPFVPDKEGYEFTGWESNVPGSTVEQPTGDTIFKATYRQLMEYKVRVDYRFKSDETNTVKAQPSAVYEISEEDAKKGLTVVTPKLDGFEPDQDSVSFSEAEIKSNKIKTVVYTGTLTTYTVKHMQQTADGKSYTEKATETINSEVGRTTTAKAKTYTGFTALEVEQKTVAANGATTVEVKYDRNYYAVTYDSDGGTPVQGGLYRYGDTVTLSAVPTKVGYTFSHWTLDGTKKTSVTMPTKDITLKAVWTLKTKADYTIRYWVMNLDNPSTYDFVSETVKNGTVGQKAGTISVSKDVLSAKYESNSTFRNNFFTLNTSKSDVNASGAVKSKTIAADGTTVYNVYFDRAKMTFTFKNGSSTVTTRTGYYGQTFVQAGYAVGEGWPNPGAGYIWQGDGTGITTLYWTYLNGFTNDKLLGTVNVTFNKVSRSSTKKVYQYIEKLYYTKESNRWQQADLFESLKGNFNVTAKFEPGFDLYGYTVDKSSVSTTSGFTQLSDVDTVDSDEFSSNIRIYHKRREFTVSFTNCKKNPSSITYLFEQPLSDKTLPGKNDIKPPANIDSDYVFAGWYRESGFVNQVTDADGEVVGDLKMPAGNLQLHAKWVKPSYKVTFYKNYSASDTAKHATKKVTKYNTVESKMPADPTRTGYTFGGWYVNRECTIGFLSNTTVINNISVYAKWIPAGNPVYTVKYQDEQGKTLADDKIVTSEKTVGSTITENAIHISGYAAKQDSISFVLNYGSEIIFVYSKLEPWTLTVNYLEKGTNVALVKQKTAVVTERSIVEVFVPVTGYNVEHGTEIQTATKESPIINFFYEPIVPGSVTVEYYYEQEDGSYEKETVTLDPQPVGDTVKVEPKNETKYEGQDYLLDEDNDENKFTDIVTKEGTTLKVYYELPIRDVSLTVDDKTVTYNGETQTSDKPVQESPLKDGHKWEYTYTSATGEDVGTTTGSFTNVKIVDEDGNDVSSQYNITTDPGKLTIDPLPVTVTITGNKDEKVYNGKEQQVTGYEVKVSNPLYKKTDFTFSGTDVAKGTDVGTYPMGLKEEQFKNKNDNFVVEFEVNDGELKITPVTTPINIVADSAEKTYDGEALTENGFTYTAGILAEGDNLVVEVEGSQTNVGSSANKVVSYKVMRGDKDVTAYYTFGTPVDGTLKVNQKPIEITADSANKVYDGEPLTKNSYTAGATAKDDTIASVKVSGSQTNVGSSANVASNAVIVDAAGNDVTANYAITYVPGKLTVTKQPVTITADSAEKVYDGTALTKNSYTVAGLKQGDKIASVKVNGSQTDAGSSANVASNAVIVDAAGNDVTANYDISYVPGTLNVSKKPLVITAGSAEKEYDGTPLTEDSYTVGDLAAGDVVESVDVNGSQTLVGSSDNVASNAVIKDGGKDVTKNYAITYVPGTLTVTGDPMIADKTTPAVESNYKLGETVPFQITVKNIMDKELKNVTVEDESAIIVAGTGYVVEGGVAKIASIPVGGSAVVNAQHVVTEEDILAGTYENTAKVTAENKVLYASCEVEVEDPAPHLTLTKITTNNINKDVVFDLGDVIEYEIKVVNDGNLTVTDIVVTDEMTGDVWTVEALKPGESASFNAEYVVTEGDLFRDTVVNVATATGKSEDPKNPEVPTEPGRTEDEIADPNPGFTVVKAITDTPENGLDYYELGETVDFSVTVTNYGNVTLNNVTIGEVLADAKFVGEAEGVTISEDGATAVIASIDPARKGNNVVVLAAQYTIKETDLGNEDLENMLTGKATYDNPEDPDDPEIPVDPDPIDPVPIPVDAVTSVNVTKVWDDQDNAFNTRSESIEVTLYQNVAGEKIAYKTATLTADAWSCSFEMLPAHKNGELIDYTVEEAEMVDENGVVIYTASYDKVETETGADWTITNTLQKYTLTIRYWFEEIGGEEAAKTFVREYYYGEAYNVTSPRITGYSVDKKTVSGVITKDAEYDVIYTPVDYRLTVYYVYEDGTTAARTHRETLRYKDKYSVDSPEISGYVASIKRVAGTMPGRDLKYTVIYVPETVIIEEYGVPLNLGNVVMNVGDCFE